MTDHADKALEALRAAEALRPEHPAWSLVPLFYSAMHLIQARFVASGIRVPPRHRSRRDENGTVLAEGMNDAVARHCPPDVSVAYRSLFDAGRVVRYDLTPLHGQLDRFWEERRTIHTWVIS